MVLLTQFLQRKTKKESKTKKTNTGTSAFRTQRLFRKTDITGCLIRNWELKRQTRTEVAQIQSLQEQQGQVVSCAPTIICDHSVH